MALLDLDQILHASPVLDSEGLQHLLDSYRLLNRQSEEFGKGLQILADASRKESWRDPLRTTGVLERVLQELEPGTTRNELAYDMLRLICNCCADNDENRKKVKQWLPKLILCLESSDLRSVSIVVLFNLCSQWEPGQIEAAKQGLHKTLLHLWVDGTIGQNGSSAFHAAELLATVLGHTAAADVAELASIQVLELALQLPLGVADVLEYLTFGRISLVFLENETLHDQLAQTATVIKVLRLLEDNVDRVGKIAVQNEEEKEDLEAVTALGDQILACVCDISLKITAPEDFTNDTLVKQLRDWTQCRQEKLATCACLVLGNLARSDSVCELIMGVNAENGPSYLPESPSTTPIHLDLLHILKDNCEKSLAHAALGFLFNLAHPTSNKAILGSAGAIEMAVSLISASAFESEVNLAVIRLVRQLLRDSFENSRRLLRPVPPELMYWFKTPSETASREATDAVSTDSSVANIHTSDLPQTFLSVLLQLNSKSDRPDIRMEIGRTVMCACRTFYSTFSRTEDVEKSLAIFYKHSTVSKAVVSMVTQGQWPALRSEGWFGLGLMARSKDGARLLSDELKAEPFVAMLRTTMEQRQSSDTEEITTRREDRENAIALVHGLINNAGDAVDPRHRDMMLSLLNEYLKDTNSERTLIIK